MYRRAAIIGLLAASAAGCTPREPPQVAPLAPVAHPVASPTARSAARPRGKTGERAALRHHVKAFRHPAPARHRAEAHPRWVDAPRREAPMDLRLRRD